MAELSSQFASISPGMDTETATDDLVSTMQAFGIATDEVERKVMDNINAIGNSMATTNAEIGEMLKRSSAAMKAANNSLEQTVALESAAVQITRNAETTGTAFRTISMRIRGYSEESEDGLEEVDEELKNISGDIADLTKINGKGGISIFTDESRNEYKSTYQILKEISEIWNDLTDAQQAGLLEKLAGKRGGQVLAGILADFSSVDEAMETMENAAGSADKEMDIIRDSIEYKLNAIKQQWVGTLTDIAGRDEIKGILDFVLKLSEGLGGIISDLGVLKTAIIGVATVVGSQKLGLFDTGNNKTLIGGIAEIRNNRRTAAMKREGLSQILDIYGNKPDQFLTDLPKLVDDFEPIKSILVDIQNQAEKTGATGEEALGMVGDAMGDVEIEGSHLGGIFKNIGKSLVNGLASAAISAAITFAIDGLSKWIDTAIMTEAEAQRLSDKFSDAYDSMASDATKTAKEISDVDSEFMQLSKGVNSLGENVSLTDEEFERYHEITSLIADKMPEMVDGYDAQGQAIIRLRDNVNSLTEAYIDNQQEAARELYEKEDDDGSYIEGIYKNAQDKSKSIWSGEHYGVGRWIDIQEQRATYARAASLSYKDAMDALKSNEYIEDILRDAGLNEKTTEEDFYGKIHETLVRDTEKLEVDLQNIAKKVQKAGTTFAKIYTGYYDDLTDTQRKYFDATVKHFDFDYLYNNGLLSKDEMEDSMRNLANTFKNLTSEESSKLEMRVNLITQLNSGEITVGEYLAKLKELEQWLNDLPDSDLTRYFTIIFGINEQDESKVTKAKERLMKLMGDNYSEEIFNKLSVDDLDKIMNIPIKPAFDERGFEKNIQTLYDEKGFVLNVLPEVNQYSVDEIKSILTDGVNPIELEPVVNPADSIKSMAELESAVGSLSDLYNQVIKKSENYDPETSGYTFGFANASTLESVKSAFSKYIETIGDDATREKLSNVLIAFDREMIENAGDSTEAIEARQKAMDKLITAYVDQFDWIKNLTEENKEWAKQKLTDIGITNAEEFVESRLNKTNQKLLKGTKKLSDVFRDHTTELAKVNEGTKEWYDTIGRLDEKGIATEGSILESVRNMFSIEDADGNIVNQSVIDNIDTQFIIDNLDLIRQVAEGDAEAIDNLRAKLMEPIVAEIEINGADETEINDIRDHINDLIRNADIENWTIDTDINEKPLIQGLNQLVQVGQITRDQMNAILTGIGVEPYVEKTVPISIGVDNYASVRSQLASAYGSSYAAEQAAKAGMGSGGGTVQMPVIKYRVGSGGISNAHFAPKTSNANTNKGGSGGGGGSENKLQKDTEESFDWIETKIQRLDEEISSLDKTVGNVYENWTDRNKALGKELEKVREEMEVHQHAYNRYLENANAVKVKNPKDDDEYSDRDAKQKEYDQSQYDAAVKAWATGEYQRKVREGLIGEGDIEKIENKWLADAIKEYQELYNKAVQMGIAVEDDIIKLGDLNKTKFDNIQSEFEGIAGLFESEADSVDKLIERTEEHGFFVSEKYYDKKKDLVQDQIDLEKRELYDLTETRDAAVASGAIKEGSEEWTNMTKKIMDTENEVQGLYTELIQLDNQQRQLRWDGFDYAIDKLSEITNEVEFLQDLLDNKDLFEYTYDESGKKTYDGTMSDRGWASAGLHATEYNNQLVKAKYAAQELAKVEAELTDEKKKNDKNLLARRQEMLELQRDSIKAAEAEKEAIRDLVEEGINKHLEALQSLIDKYKEGLSDAKDLYDYQKNIASQTKQISSLQKQLSAYSGDDSEEARATIQKLTESLDEAQTNLKETEWDRYISETNDMLDTMYEEYENFLNQRLDDTDALMTYMTDQINARGEDIQTTIEDAADDYAYTTTTEFQSLFEGNGQLISDFNGNFNDFASTTIDALKKLVDNTLELTKGNNVMDQVESEGLTAKSGKSKNGWWYRNADGSFAANEYRDGYWYNSEGYWDNGSKAEWKSNSKGTWYQNADGWYPKNQWLKIDGDWYYFDEKGYMVTGDRQIGSKKHQFASSGKWLREYATGSKRITEDQLAWTQEQGSELIFRSSDGAMLTPLNKGDMVFTADMTKNLWDIAKNPAYANTTVKIPDSTVAARTINNDNALTVVLPNVQSYEDFKQALMKDKQITNFVQSATFGQALGKGQLNRGNY